MLWRQLDKRELSAEPDPARTGCVQAGLTNSEKKTEGRPQGGRSVVKPNTKKDFFMCRYRICEDGQRTYRESKNSSDLVHLQVRCSSVAFPLCKSRYYVNRTVCAAMA